MRRAKLACFAVVLAGVATQAAAQPAADGTRDGPFKTVHLMVADAAQAAALRAAVRDFNGELTREGCGGCAYHLLSRFEGSQSPYSVLLYADWPSRREYRRLHDSAAYAAVAARHPVFPQLEATQLYGRFSEAP